MTRTSAVGASLFPANPGIWEKIGHVLFILCHVVDLPGPMRLGALLRSTAEYEKKITGIFFPPL